jgi:hypothetical protein
MLATIFLLRENMNKLDHEFETSGSLHAELISPLLTIAETSYFDSHEDHIECADVSVATSIIYLEPSERTPLSGAEGRGARVANLWKCSPTPLKDRPSNS